jgi:hypothetical protein
MKKLSLFLVAVVATMSVSAQSLMPKKGDFGLEIGLTPFSQNAVFCLLDDGVKMRYFLTDADALRLQVGFIQSLTADTEIHHKAAHGIYDILAGYERHFNMSDRIDLYAGAQAGFLKEFAYYKTVSSTHVNTDLNGHIGVNHFMAGALTGIDVYLWKGLYCGAEMGLKWNITREGTKKEKDDNGGTTIHPAPTVTASAIGFYIDPAIRLGWTF